MKKQRIKARVSDLVLNEGQIDWLPRNPRQWTQDDIDRTKASLLRDSDFQEDRPLLVLQYGDSLLVFAGNLRTTSAKSLNWDTLEAVLYTPETEDDRVTVKRRAMLDNGSFGEWDVDVLANEWDDQPLKEWGVDVNWDFVKAEDVSSGEYKEVEEDDFDVEKDHIAVRCKQGDIWQLGDHRLMCGDSVNLEDVKKLMGGGRGRPMANRPTI